MIFQAMIAFALILITLNMIIQFVQLVHRPITAIPYSQATKEILRRPLVRFGPYLLPLHPPDEESEDTDGANPDENPDDTAPSNTLIDRAPDFEQLPKTVRYWIARAAIVRLETDSQEAADPGFESDAPLVDPEQKKDR